MLGIFHGVFTHGRWLSRRPRVVTIKVRNKFIMISVWTPLTAIHIIDGDDSLRLCVSSDVCRLNNAVPNRTASWETQSHSQVCGGVLRTRQLNVEQGSCVSLEFPLGTRVSPQRASTGAYNLDPGSVFLESSTGTMSRCVKAELRTLSSKVVVVMFAWNA